MRLRREQPEQCHLPEINDGWSVGEAVDDRIRWSWRKKGFGVAVHSSGLRQNKRAAGAGAMMLRSPPLFCVHRLCGGSIARTDIDGEKDLAAIAIWQ